MRRPAAAGSTGPDAGNVRNLDEGVAHAANAARKEGLLDEEDERQMASQTPSEQLHTLVEALRRAIKHLADDLKEQPEASRDSADEARLYTQQETLEALLKVMQGLESGTAASPRPATGSGGTGDPGGPGGTGGPAGAADAEGDHKAHASKEEKPRAERDPGNLQDMMSEFMKMQEMLSTVQGMIIDTFLSQLKMLTEMIKKINEIATSAI
ncbi:MAG TPA: hypothetical protein VEC35_14880 [Noviherbaspirillum sp.]|nr:hypothetical protein [Noviherbaspirillum sp.]